MKIININGLSSFSANHSAGRDVAHPAVPSFSRLIAESRDVYFHFSLPSQGFTYVSAAAPRLFGYPPSFFASSANFLENIIHPDWRAVFAAHWKKSGRSEVTTELEYQIIHASGGVRWIRQREVLVRDVAGVPIAIEGVLADITREKEAEKERLDHLYFLRCLELVNRAMLRETEPEEMLRQVIAQVFAIFDCDRAWLLYPCDPEAATFRIPMETTRAEYPGALALNLEVPMASSSARDCREALAAEGPVTYVAGTAKPVSEDTRQRFAVQSQIFMAIYPTVGSPWLFGMHQCSHARVWKQNEISLFNEIGQRLTDSLSCLLALRTFQQTSAQYQTLIETMNEGLVVVDKAGRIIYANKKLCDLLGFGADELQGRDIRSFFDPAASSAGSRLWLTGEVNAHATAELNWIRKDGTALATDVAPQPLGEAHWGGTFAIITDITRRQQVERELESYRDNLEYLVRERTADLNKSNRELQRQISERQQLEEERIGLLKKLHQAQKMEAIGAISAAIAHDFNNILNIIFGFVQHTKTIVSKESQIYRNLEVIAKTGERAANLVKQILTFCRQSEKSIRPVSLQALLSDLIEGQQKIIPPSIKICKKITGNCIIVAVDPIQMQQVISNLLVNAIQAMQERGGVLEVGLQRKVIGTQIVTPAGPPPGEYAHLWLTDTGHGMDQETVQKIFDPYFTTKEKNEGSGLGLAIVYGILKAYSAFVTVDSTVGQGTTFAIFFPLSAEGSSPAEVAQLTGSATLQGRRILFIDDEKVSVMIWEKILSRRGAQVIGHTSPLAALAAFEKDPQDFDLIITDQVMPELTGTDLIRIVKTIRPSMPIILTTGWAGSITQLEIQQEERVAILLKPHTLEEMVTALNNIL